MVKEHSKTKGNYLNACLNGVTSIYPKIGVTSSEEKLKAGAFYIPRGDLMNPQRADANFVCKDKQTIGVADGVGTWDRGVFAREIMHESVKALRLEPKRNVDLKRVLDIAFMNTTSFEGASTACIVTLRGRQLHVVNVGDSGFMLFRDKKLTYQSPIQLHWFNCPYQLGNGMESDKPNVCNEIQLEVEVGDVVIFATDGLFDNMYATDIEEFLKDNTREGMRPKELARTMAEMALCYSQNKDRISPFAKVAQEAGRPFTGGKEDDITVVVGLIESIEP